MLNMVGAIVGGLMVFGISYFVGRYAGYYGGALLDYVYTKYKRLLCR